MVNQEYVSNWQHIQEYLLTNLLGNIPTNIIGGRLRNFLYRQILRKIGKSVYIEKDVKILNASCIEIGNKVQLLRHVNLDARWHSNNRIYLGDNVSVEQGVDIRALNNTSVEIHEGTFIGPYVCIAGSGNIKIGKNCLIAAQTGLFANNHLYSNPTENINSQGVSREGILIEDDCWLGSGVKVLDGVKIGEGIKIPFDCGFAGKIATSGQRIIVDDLSTIEVVSPILRDKGIRSIIGVPLQIKKQVSGVLHVGKIYPHQFTKENIQQLQLIANNIGLAIEPFLQSNKLKLN